MARPREFDEDEVLDRALNVFWEHGYAATSVSHLTKATGLAKGSLYKAFTDKRTLFLRTLDRYLERGASSLNDGARTHEPLEALRRWLLDIVDMATCDGTRRGCMAVNCTIELAPHDEEVREVLHQQAMRIERVYARLLRQAVEAGELPRDLEPAAGARWLTTIVNGLQVRGKLGLDRRRALETVDMALEALRQPAR